MANHPDTIGTSNIFNKNIIDYMNNAEIQLGFPKVFKSFKTFLTTPTSTVSCERNVSCLHRLITYLRTMMD